MVPTVLFEDPIYLKISCKIIDRAIKCEMRLQKTLTKLCANYSTHKIGKYVTLTLNYFWHFHLNIFWSNRIFFVNILCALSKFQNSRLPKLPNFTKAPEVKKCPRIYDISMNDFWFTLFNWNTSISIQNGLFQMRFIKGVHSDTSAATRP